MYTKLYCTNKELLYNVIDYKAGDDQWRLGRVHITNLF